MSERLSQTAGETFESTQTLGKRARGFLTTPAGKFIGGALIVIGGVSAAAKEAVADTVFCLAKKAGSAPTLMADKIGTDIDPASLTQSRLDGVPKMLNDNVFCQSSYWNGTEWIPNYKVFGPDLQLRQDVESPGTNLNRIGENGIAVSTDDTSLFHFNGTAFEAKGYGPYGSDRASYGGKMFIQNIQTIDGIDTDTIHITSESDILNNGVSDTVQSIPWRLNKRPLSGTDGFAIDQLKSVLVVAITKKLNDQDENGQNGYMEIPLPSLDSNGELPDPNTWAQDYPEDGINGVKFVPTPFEINKVYIDSRGDRFFVSREGINSTMHICTEEGLILENVFLSNIKILINNALAVTVLPSGGLLIIEDAGTIPLIFTRESEVPTDVNIICTDQGYTLYESPDFPGNGAYGVIQGCNAIDPAYEPVDPIPETVETAEVAEPSPDVIEPDAESDVTGGDEGSTVEPTPDATGNELSAEEIEEADIPEAGEDIVLDSTGDIIDTDKGNTDEGKDLGADDVTTGDVDKDSTTPPEDTTTGTCETNPRLCDSANTELPEDIPSTDNPVPPKDVSKDAESDNGVVEKEGGGGGGCSSVPNGVNDTRAGVAAIMLAALAALSGSRWRRREDEVKL